VTISLPGLPALHWTGVDGDAEYDEDARALTLRAARGVDWTNDAIGGPAQHAATALAFPAPHGDFVLAARVRVSGARSTFDAGALALWSRENRWAKLCNEYSPQGDAMVVSVVTNEFSDDANGPLFPGEAVHLRVARTGPAFAFHYSLDALSWHFVRLFRVDADPSTISVGFLAQAPMGEGAAAVFDEIAYAERSLGDLRDLR
jgi:regulation of enolase protein 1 (concanavalin A-like superfamily)